MHYSCETQGKPRRGTALQSVRGTRVPSEASSAKSRHMKARTAVPNQRGDRAMYTLHVRHSRFAVTHP